MKKDRQTSWSIDDRWKRRPGPIARDKSVLSTMLLHASPFNEWVCDRGAEEIAEQSGVSRPTVYRSWEQLETWGLIERVPSGWRLLPDQIASEAPLAYPPMRSRGETNLSHGETGDSDDSRLMVRQHPSHGETVPSHGETTASHGETVPSHGETKTAGLPSKNKDLECPPITPITPITPIKESMEKPAPVDGADVQHGPREQLNLIGQQVLRQSASQHADPVMAALFKRKDGAEIAQVVRRGLMPTGAKGAGATLKAERYSSLQRNLRAILLLWDEWRQDAWFCGNPGAMKLTQKRLEKLCDRFMDSSLDELRTAMKGVKLDPWYIENDRYRDIPTVFRDRDQIEKFCRLAERGVVQGKRPPGPQYTPTSAEGRAETGSGVVVVCDDDGGVAEYLRLCKEGGFEPSPAEIRRLGGRP